MSRYIVKIVVADREKYRRLGLMLEALELMTGEKVAEEVTVAPEGQPGTKKATTKKGPKVEYHIAMSDAVDTKLIEENTVKGKLFLYLLHQGPSTAQGIFDAFKDENWTMKGVESAVHHLKTMGIIKPVEVSPLPDVDE